MKDYITEQKEKELIVAKIDCGSNHGNAILVDTKHAITVKHCITDAYENGRDILLSIISCQNGSQRQIKAVIDERFNEEIDELVMLELEQEVEVRVIKQFAEVELSIYSQADTYGYDANYRLEGCWTTLKSIGSAHNNPEYMQDQIFHLIDSKEQNFSGLSGSPIFQGEYIIGIVSQQKNEKGNAIDLRGISVKSSSKFMDKYGIDIEKLPLVKNEQEFEQPIMGEKFQSKNNPIAVAGGFGYQGILSGKYMDELNIISELHYKGNVALAWEKLKNGILELERESVDTTRVKAEYYMKMAIWYLEDRKDIKKAQKKYEIALAYCSDIDGSIFLTLKNAYQGNRKSEEILEPINSVQKLNIYMQICINNGKVDKAFEKYDTVVGIIQENDVTYYLLSIMELLHQRYDRAMKYIDLCLERNFQIPIYHIMKANILYWKAIPADVRLSNEIYPPMFCNGMIHLEVDEIACLKEASISCRMAYTFALGTNNNELIAQILGIWINILSVETDMGNDILEPLQLLRKMDSLNITVLLYSILKNLELDESITVEAIEKRLKTDKNKIGYAIVLIEFCLKKNDYMRAKQCLHEYRFVFNRTDYLEYWYEYIARLESEPAKLEKYQKELENEKKMDSIQKKRLSCLFLEKKMEELSKLEQTLLEIYSITQKRIDLMNIISFYRTNMRWDKVEEYSEILVEIFGDRYGYIYHIRALIQLEKYEEAYEEVEELQRQQIPHTFVELIHDKMIILDRLGQYDKAIEAGELLIKENPTEQALIQLSTIYIRNGEPDRALGVLLRAERDENLTTEMCQRISTIYLANDWSKAWKYAQKAVKLSENNPKIMLWAIDIANHSGHSEQASEYYHEVFTKDLGTQVYQVKSIEEVLQIMQQTRTHEEEMVQKYEAGQLPAHLYVDDFRGNLTYGEFFYKQWNAQNMAPLEFGAHNFSDEKLKLNGKIGLDYSSCILLHEIEMLDILAQYVSEIYVSGELFGVIDTELRKIPISQQDLAEERIALLEYCEKLGAKAVNSEVPEEIKDYGVSEQNTIMCQHTAMHNGALWITSEKNHGINPMDVIEVLYRENEITECLYRKYSETKLETKEENISLLQQSNSNILLVDGDVLLEWKKFSLLEAVCKKYSVLFLESMLNGIRREQQEIYEKEKICKQLKSLNEHLRKIRDLGKLKFYPVQEQKENMTYSNMLVELLMGASRWNIPICIDDRVMTSYPTIGGGTYIYNSFDVMKILYMNNQITLEKYCDVLQKLYDVNIQYVLPDGEYLLHAVELSYVDHGSLVESRMLSGIRKNVLCALSEQSHISHEIVEHVRLPEREYYVFNLQRETGKLIENIWQSSETLQKKCLASDWILWHYSQFAFSYCNSINVDSRKYIQAVFLADFLVKGMLITVESDIEKYYDWMYQWMDTFFEQNKDIKERTLAYTKEFLVNFLEENTNKERNKKEQRIIRWKMATAIHLMPEEYRKIILKDNMLLNMHDKLYSEISLVLTQSNQIPVEQFVGWEWEILKCAESEPICKRFQKIDYELSWESQIPALPGMIIQWEQNGQKHERRLYMERGKRLLHPDKTVRKAEFRAIETYLLDLELDYSRSYLVLMKGTDYEVAGKEILEFLDLSVEYEYKRMEYGLQNSWFANGNCEKLFLPEKPDFFKQFFDWKCDGGEFENVKENILMAVPIQLETKVDCSLNYNPVRKLRQLAQTLKDNPQEAVTVTIEMFSYIDGENAIYGHLYILLLKAIWKLFGKLENYKNEAEVNRIIWSYLWADQAMTCVSKWMKKDGFNLAEFVSSLEETTKIDIEKDGLWDNVGDDDVLSPLHMNLFKLCVIGTFNLCDKYKKQIEIGLETILKYADEHLKNWFASWINFREMELSHRDDKNMLCTIFEGNFFSIVGSLFLSIDKNFANIEQYFCIDNRIALKLNAIFEDDEFTEHDLGYLFLLVREGRTEHEVRQIEKIIEKHVMGKELVVNQIRYCIIANIVKSLSDEFQERFISFEYDRISKALSLNPKEWSQYYNLAVELYQKEKASAFVCFLERCVDEWEGAVNLKFAEMIGQLQLFLPYECSDKLISLRIKYELKDS